MFNNKDNKQEVRFLPNDNVIDKLNRNSHYPPTVGKYFVMFDKDTAEKITANGNCIIQEMNDKLPEDMKGGLSSVEKYYTSLHSLGIDAVIESNSKIDIELDE